MGERPKGGEREVEITPEMVEAGIDALASSDDRVEGVAQNVARIYRAMAAARRPKTATGP